MSLQSVSNSLSLQQIMLMLQQQSLASADPEAAAADQAGTPDVTGQNLPGDQAPEEDSAGQAPQVTSAKATLDPSTIKTLLQIQEEQTQAAPDLSQPDLSQPDLSQPDLSQPDLSQPDLSQVDAVQLESLLAAMTGSAASGSAIAGLTQTIMSLLGGDAGDTAEDSVSQGAGEAASTTTMEE